MSRILNKQEKWNNAFSRSAVSQHALGFHDDTVSNAFSSEVIWIYCNHRNKSSSNWAYQPTPNLTLPLFTAVTSSQRRIFIFGALGYFKLGALLEGSRRLMSYKLALQVLAIFTEQVVPVQKHIALFWIPSISGTKTVIMYLTKKPAVKLPGNTPITYSLSSLCNCTVCKC